MSSLSSESPALDAQQQPPHSGRTLEPVPAIANAYKLVQFLRISSDLQGCAGGGQGCMYLISLNSRSHTHRN